MYCYTCPFNLVTVLFSFVKKFLHGFILWKQLDYSLHSQSLDLSRLNGQEKMVSWKCPSYYKIIISQMKLVFYATLVCYTNPSIFRSCWPQVCFYQKQKGLFNMIYLPVILHLTNCFTGYVHLFSFVVYCTCTLFYRVCVPVVWVREGSSWAATGLYTRLQQWRLLLQDLQSKDEGQRGMVLICVLC